MVIVDDRILLDLVAGLAEPAIGDALERGEVFTTGCWYYRLSRALSSTRVTGSLSRRLEALDQEAQARVLRAMDRLPAEVGLVSLRDLVPVMRALQVTVPLNMLAAEALAAALLLDGGLVVTTDAPQARRAAAELGVPYRLVAA